MKFKIAQIITTMEPGGAQASTLNLAAGLAGRPEFETHLVCGGQGPLDPASAEGVKVHRIPSLVRSPSPLRDLAALFALYRLFRAENFDIVHTHSSKAGLLGRMAAAAAGTGTVVHTIHGFAFHPFQNALTRRILIAAERMAARMSDRLVCVCESDIEKGLAARVGRGGQYRLIRDFFDPARPETMARAKKAGATMPEIRTGPKAVVMAACLKPQKDPLTFVRAARIVSRKRKDCTFVLAGDGALRPKVEAEIRKLGLEENFLLPGWTADMDALLRRADAFVLTSIHEGLPMALIEAMAKGIPVAASAVDGNREAVEGAGYGLLFGPKDAQAAARAICEALDSPPRAPKTEFMDEFRMDRNLALMAALYCEKA